MRWETAATIVGLVLALGVLAGCIGSEGSDEIEAQNANESDPSGEPAPAFDPVTNLTDETGAEPVVDVASDGTIFLQALGGGNTVMRSTDGGKSWEDVEPVTGRQSGDAFVAVGNDDTVYVANSFAQKLVVHRSDDLGDSWTLAGQPPVDPPMHRMWLVPEGETTVHLLYEKFIPAPPTPGAGVPIVYYTRSENAGQTWTPTTIVDDNTHYGSDLAVGPDGTLYTVRLDDRFSEDGVPDPSTSPDRDTQCAQESGWYVLVSKDGGLTWEQHDLFATGGEQCNKLSSGWQSLETDAEGNVYFLWGWQQPSDTARIHLSVSNDQGASWSTPKPLFPDQGAQVLPWFEVKAPGELGVVWYAADEQGVPEEMDTNWYVDYGHVLNATSEDPTTDVTRVTPFPVHEGNICTKGLQCDSDEDRSLLDYTWITFGPEDRAHLAAASTQSSGSSPFPVYAGEAPTGAS